MNIIKVIHLEKPNKNSVEEYIEKWNKLENYVMQEKALDKLFFELCPSNKKIEDILIKCSTLNDFYSTNIFSIYSIAKHIQKLDIDGKLKKWDKNIVNEIAKVSINWKEKNFYSFASKYCSHHKPLEYPIYDNYIGKCLMYFKKEDKFENFHKEDLKNYGKFTNILNKFRSFYWLEKYSLKEIDRYLWQLWKEVFPKTYY